MIKVRESILFILSIQSPPTVINFLTLPICDMSTPLPPPPSPTKPPPATPPHHLIQRCTSLSQLKQIHAQMIRSGFAFSSLPASLLVSSLTSSPSSLDYARLVFSQIPNPTTFTSNSIIRAYTNNFLTTQALRFYIDLLRDGHVPDNFTFPSLFKSCRDPGLGRQLHSHAVKFGFGSDTYVQNTLMRMYSECGSLDSACQVFGKMPNRTVVAWATMIAAYTRWADPVGGLELYRAMMGENKVEPNEIVLVNVVTACARARDLETARKVHRYIEENGFGFNLVLWAALLDVYCKCGRVSTARKLFDKMPEKDLFCWNIMIKGYVEGGDYAEAVRLFREMQSKGIRGDQITMASLVLACTHLGAVELGKWLHLYIQREKIEVDVILATALVDMYAKCGCVDNAMKVLEEMPCKDVTIWTALIGGLATSGHEERALQAFDEMERSGVIPDAVTFVGVLTACSHAGLYDKGRSYFDAISRVYNIKSTVEHYGWMIDLYSRAGLIDHAEEFIRRMPMAPDYFMLSSLLSACRVHGNLEVAERTAKQILELNSKNGAVYVMLSNMYASLKNVDESNRVRELMREKNIKKPPGCSLIEVEGEVHEFVTGDQSHPRSADIYAMIEDMMIRSKAVGCVRNEYQVILNMDEEEDQEDCLCWHSEKLAIAFGLISTSPGTPIRVRRNLRVCSDCHGAIKVVAEVYGREIVVRDRFRFHRFRDGSCSCKDFW